VAPAHLTLVLGGVRSGKSHFAERLAIEAGGERVYVATAEPFDEAMRHRITLHRLRRGSEWRTLEAPLELEAALNEAAAPGRVVLVDCLSLWVTNLMLAGRDVTTASEAVVQTAASLPGHLLLVSNEVGLGGIEVHPMARGFADHVGRLHQDLAQVATEVVLVVAGQPLWLKR
jgi:adenosylcobinamide kinase/adenosylcobinamide-phosphate guanylyltransferase